MFRGPDNGVEIQVSPLRMMKANSSVAGMVVVELHVGARLGAEAVLWASDTAATLHSRLRNLSHHHAVLALRWRPSSGPLKIRLSTLASSVCNGTRLCLRDVRPMCG